MARQARGEYLNPDEIQVVHAVQRCVRQAFLCGLDKNTGNNYEHRRQWIRERFEFLASVFGIDCLTYTVLSNHLHIVLRSRPDVVNLGQTKRSLAVGAACFPNNATKMENPWSPPSSSSTWCCSTLKNWPKFGDVCRISAGGCVALPRQLLAKPTRRIGQQVDFGRADIAPNFQAATTSGRLLITRCR